MRKGGSKNANISGSSLKRRFKPYFVIFQGLGPVPLPPSGSAHVICVPTLLDASELSLLANVICTRVA